jgi:hypothetical protein
MGTRARSGNENPVHAFRDWMWIHQPDVSPMRRLITPTVLALALLATVMPARAAAPLPAQPAASTKRHLITHHHRYRHHTRVRVAHVAPPPAVTRPDPNALAEAPVPNENIGPPNDDPPPNVPSLHPGNLQLHFPNLGDGYLPASDSATMDNEHAPTVPGLTVRVPLTQSPPTPTPQLPPATPP